ncbi:fatty acid--CoA ligase family protein [Candidatus Pelagibacter sp.]|nr:fatty acid--CoA ligase family protein [Candidatus Pelagibacter sp.]
MNEFKKNKKQDALVWNEKVFNYEYLLMKIDFWRKKIKEFNIKQGSVVGIEGDYSPSTIALFFVLIEENCIIVPIAKVVGNKKSEFLKISQAEYIISINENDEILSNGISQIPSHKIILKLKREGNPGLILFSSGTTGQSKASVHNFVPLLKKFSIKRNKYRTIIFLLYDHIGGINTLFYTLSNAGCLITVKNRNPSNVANVIEKFKAELLPTTPTFLNMMLLDTSIKKSTLKTLKLVTYGTEPMQEITLRNFNSKYPHIKLLQTYGLSEIGILRSKSKNSNSLWVKIGGEDFETRVVDELLEIKAKSAMLGYLNAESPFTDDGWFKTGDQVQIDGEYLKILGRKSDIINIGGQKVFPAEIENIIQNITDIDQVTVFSEKNIIMGEIVCAKVYSSKKIEKKIITQRIKKFCKEKLLSYQVPSRIILSKFPLHNQRFKTNRSKINNDY